MTSGRAFATIAALALCLLAAGQMAFARERTIEITDLDAILKANPLSSGGPTASVVASRRAGKGELQIVRAQKIPLHIPAK